MKLTGSLYAINSTRDSSGNEYWALRYVDHETGKVVEGTFSGNESNLYGVLRHWNTPDDWDRSIIFNRLEMPKKQFKGMIADWPYAGCSPQDIAAFIKAELAKPTTRIHGES